MISMRLLLYYHSVDGISHSVESQILVILISELNICTS
uniref:Uncharacterized protein n=1 Tax=Arundo donax TaxID=35708 RepID=A0A0A9H3Y6_ARUDO